MKVKICGIKNIEAARYAVELGVDALGFVFAESKRKLTAPEAKKIIDAIPGDVWKVGVFVNEEIGTVKKIAYEAGLTHIQLHGEENPEDYFEIGLPIIKSAAVKSKADLGSLDSIKANYILLDSPPGKYQGGNGTRFDWNDAIGLAKPRSKVILAGGLNPSNVKVAIDKVDPFMVDVSSGVETDGEKDFDKIRHFVTSAKSSEGEGTQ